MQNLYANEILLIVAILFVKILNDWHSAFLVIFRWFYRGGTAWAAKSRTWVRGQHKYYGFVNSKTDGKNAAVLFEL